MAGSKDKHTPLFPPLAGWSITAHDKGRPGGVTFPVHNIPFELSDYVLRKTFTECASRQGWLNEERIIAAVSGGGDSASLLLMAAKFFTGHITALHVHHGMRGKIADEDEEFVKSFAESLGCGFVSERVSVYTSRLKGESVEETGRRLRHECIIRTAKALGVRTVLLGHNRDDLAETVLFNLLRGTGIRGAVGITETTEFEGVKLCRPLLAFRRGELRELLRVRGISWREDCTNDDENFTRNYIRRKLLPELEEHINSQVIEHLADFGQDMRIIREREDEESIRLFTECAESDSVLDMKKLRRLSGREKALVIREAGRKLSLRTLSRERCDNLAGLIARSGRFTFQWVNGVTLTAQNGKLTFNDERGHQS
ncbi:MAG: tRNA lysidine(34) synthetase TilS [Synergistaceae bacterium]|nr:tRNA lysidine(34) synthetase TilS [Synergistaceae bacterium]